MVIWSLSVMFKVETLLFVLLFGLLTSGKDLRPQTIRFYVFDGTCPDNEIVPVDVHVKITTIRRTFYVNMKVNVTVDIISDDLQMTLFIERCQNRDALDSCEPYKTITVNNFCKILNSRKMPWFEFLSSFKPFPLRCPFKKGKYEVNNGTFDISNFMRFPISDAYWRIKVIIKAMPEEKLVECYRIEGQVAPI